MCPFMITFKYNAEHTLDSAAPSSLELLVYHKKGEKYKSEGEDDKCNSVINTALNSFKEVTTSQ